MGKTLRLVIQYGKLTAAQLSDALKERIAPQLGAASPELASFSKIFDGVSLAQVTAS